MIVTISIKTKKSIGYFHERDNMKVTTIFYFISGAGFVLIGSSIVPVSGVSSTIVGGIILVVGAFLIWAGYREYKNLKKQVNAWK
jgi:positive regulator of sigma E activity